MKPFRLLIMFLVVSGTTSLSYGQNATEAYPKEQNMNDRIFGLSKLWSEVKYNFVQIDRLDFDLGSLYMAYIPKVIEAENDIEYYNILQRFLASLNDGHTQFIIQYSWNSYYDYVPCVIKEFEGKYYITMIRKYGEINPSFLYAEILEIEGEPPLQYITSNYFPDISASTYKSRLMQANIKLMQGPINSKLNGKAKKRNGEIVDFSFTRNGETTRSDKDAYIGIEEPPLYWYNLEWSDSIAILQLNTFSPRQIPGIIDSLAGIINSRAEGLIIDLRKNGGGSSSIAEHLQMYLTQEDSISVFGVQKRVNDGYYRSQGNYRPEYEDHYLGKAYETVPPKKVKVSDSIEHFKIPVAILIGPYTYSACEDLLVNIAEMPDRPVFIGEETGGSTGAPLIVHLPHGAVARICTLRILYPYSGKPFVGEGIKPDIEVCQSFEDYIRGEDTAKNEALKYMRNEIGDQ